MTYILYTHYAHHLLFNPIFSSLIHVAYRNNTFSFPNNELFVYIFICMYTYTCIMYVYIHTCTMYNYLHTEIYIYIHIYADRNVLCIHVFFNVYNTYMEI